MQPERLTHLFAEVLRELGYNLADPNFVETPARMANAFREILRGEKDWLVEASAELSATFPCQRDALQAIGPVELVSLCPHHMLPVHYSCFMGYIPEGKVAGLSKLPRAARIVAARAVIQEDLIEELADVLVDNLQPKGVIVQLLGQHDCLRLRGARSEASLVSEAVRGVFFDGPPQARSEALEMFRTLATAASKT